MSDASPSPRSTTSPDSAGAASRGPSPNKTADIVYGAFYGGAVGGAAIAVFFLILDTLQGRPLFTPSLIGTAVFTGTDPASVTTVRMDLVAYFSLVHFAAFFALGAAASQLYLTSAVMRRQASLAAVLFGLLTVTLFAADWLVMSGVVSLLGIFQVLAANAVTAWVMAAFISRAFATTKAT